MNVPQISGLCFPELSLTSTAGGSCDLRAVNHGLLVFSPLVLPPDVLPPRSLWKEGTLTTAVEELLAFARLNEQFKSLNIALFGVTTQSPLVQKVVAEMLSLPFPLLSDGRQVLSEQFQLPMTRGGRIPRNRLMVIEVRNGSVAFVWDPLASSGQCAEMILRHLTADATRVRL